MPRHQLLLLGCALVVTGVSVSLAIGRDEKGAAPQKEGVKAVAPAESKGPAETKRNVKENDKSAPAAGNPKVEDKSNSGDEQEIRASGDAFIKAYESSSPKDIGALFTADAEYIDDEGNVIRGREAISELFDSCFTSRPAGKLRMNIETIRIISPGVAIEDGVTEVSHSAEQEPAYTRYSAVHVKTDGKWLVASVREHTPKEWRQHRSQLQQLSWLQGDWVDEGDGADVIFKCVPISGGTFLLRKFAIHVAGQEAMNGEQRIGWDPLMGKFRAWIFDSEGGFAEGFWYRDENRWQLKAVGITADGQTASSTSIYTIVDENTMTWQSVDHEVAGVQLPDSEPVTIVRRGPVPKTEFTTTSR